jgi:type II restriction enzyme
MNLKLDIRLAEKYKNLSQKVRVLTEGWVKKEAYCPSCGNVCLGQYSNNAPVADFFCENCSEDFELKSKSNGLGKKIVDGAYRTMLNRLADAHNPNFFLLNYDLNSYQVSNFLLFQNIFLFQKSSKKETHYQPPLAGRDG